MLGWQKPFHLFAKKYRALGKSGFKGIILEQLETSSDSMSFSFSLEIKTHNYPKCHQQTSKVHDYRIQMTIKKEGTFVITAIKNSTKKMIFSPAIKE